MTTSDFGIDHRVPHSKLRPPKLRYTELTRSSLLDDPRVADAEIIAIRAPGGYGKSTLAIQWAARASGAAAWVTCDESDRDPLILMTSIAAALARVVADYRLSLAGATLEEPRFSRRVLADFTASVDAIDAPVRVVVDEIHRLGEGPAADVLAAFVDALPPGSQAALVGRDLYSLPVPLWRGQGRLCDVGADDLAFSVAETAEALLRYRGRAPAADFVAKVHRSTDGWPVAVYLSSLLADDAIPHRMSGVSDYIDGEVLGAMEPGVRRFVCETAVLEVITSDIAAAVTGDGQAGAHLSRAVRGTGLIRQETADTWRCHPLLRETALTALAREEPGRVAQLRSRAADWYAERGFREEAVQQALASGDLDTMDRIIWPAAVSSLLHGRAKTVQHWLARVGEHRVLNNVDLAVIAGWTAIARGDYGDVVRHVEAALSILPQDWQEHLLRAAPAAPHLSLLLATVGADRGDPAECARLAERALSALQPDDPIRALTHTVRGLNLALVGDGAAAAELQRAAGIARATRIPSSEVEALSLLGLVHIAEGREASGLQAIDAALHCFADHDLDQMTSTAAVLAPARLARAVLTADAAEATAARAQIGHVQHDIEPVLPWFRPVAGAVLAFADVREGRLAEFPGHLAWCAGSQAPTNGLCRRWAALAQQEFDRYIPLAALSPAERRVWDLLKGRMTLVEIADELFLSRETVKSHTGAIYRKLGIASRRQAQELADTWG